METGKSSTLSTSRSGRFPGRENDEIQSIGLSFGPDFFSVWGYSDKFGETCIGREDHRIADFENLANSRFANKSALFAMSHTPIYTLVPSAMYDDSQSEPYLKFNTAFQGNKAGKTGNGTADSDDLPEAGITLVYSDPDCAQDTVDKHWPGLKVHHVSGLLIRILMRTGNASGEQCYIYAEGSTYFFFAFTNGKLLMSNSVEADHTEDTLYFTLFALKQLYKESGGTAPVTLLGAATERMDLIKGLGNYISDVDTGLNPNDLPVSGRPDAAEFARNIIGYSSRLCV